VYLEKTEAAMALSKKVAIPCFRGGCPGFIVIEGELQSMGKRNLLIISKKKGSGVCNVCGKRTTIEYMIPSRESWEISLQE
jgi:hypothetical protein